MTFFLVIILQQKSSTKQGLQDNRLIDFSESRQAGCSCPSVPSGSPAMKHTGNIVLDIFIFKIYYFEQFKFE